LARRSEAGRAHGSPKVILDAARLLLAKDRDRPAAGRVLDLAIGLCARRPELEQFARILKDIDQGKQLGTIGHGGLTAGSGRLYTEPRPVARCRTASGHPARPACTRGPPSL